MKGELSRKARPVVTAAMTSRGSFAAARLSRVRYAAEIATATRPALYFEEAAKLARTPVRM